MSFFLFTNALIVLNQDNEYCLEPVDIHMIAAMKLFRTIHNVETNISIDEALGFNNNQGNFIIRIVNIFVIHIIVSYTIFLLGSVHIPRNILIIKKIFWIYISDTAFQYQL